MVKVARIPSTIVLARHCTGRYTASNGTANGPVPKLGQDLPGLDAAPFPGPLGQRIFEGVSKRAFDLWQEEFGEADEGPGWNMVSPIIASSSWSRW